MVCSFTGQDNRAAADRKRIIGRGDSAAGQEKNGETDGDPYKGKNKDPCAGKTGDQDQGAECADRHTVSRSTTEHCGTGSVWQTARGNIIVSKIQTEYGTLQSGKLGMDRQPLCITKAALRRLSRRQGTYRSILCSTKTSKKKRFRYPAYGRNRQRKNSFRPDGGRRCIL